MHSIHPSSAESWLVSGSYSLLSKKFTQTIFMAQKVIPVNKPALLPYRTYDCITVMPGCLKLYSNDCFSWQALSQNPKCYPAYILKGLALFASDHTGSVQHFREAIRLEPYRLEGYKGKLDQPLGSFLTSPTHLNFSHFKLVSNVSQFVFTAGWCPRIFLNISYFTQIVNI